MPTPKKLTPLVADSYNSSPASIQSRSSAMQITISDRKNSMDTQLTTAQIATQEAQAGCSLIPKKAAAPAQTHAATPDEVIAILDILQKAGEWKARAAVALMFFAGLRPGEARGICWEHYDGKRLFTTQSVWHKFTTDPKTLDAASPVPVIETLGEILSDLRERDGNPSTGPILRGPSGKPMILDNLSKRVIIPALKRCSVCGTQESEHDEAEHEFKLDEVDSEVGRMVFPAPRGSNYPCGIDERWDGFEGPAAAHEPCDHDAALCEGCFGKHAICDEFAGNFVQ